MPTWEQIRQLITALITPLVITTASTRGLNEAGWYIKSISFVSLSSFATTMSISFNPPLSQLTTLQLSFPAADQVFSAKFSNIKEHARAKAAGARLELWSDIGNDEGHWKAPGALPFEWLNDSLVLKISSESFIRPLKSRFGFTYRLVYPNGDVHWMGTHDRNGELLVRVEDDRFQLPFSKGWRADGSSLVYKSPGNDSKATKLTEKANWAIWTFESERYVRCAHV